MNQCVGIYITVEAQSAVHDCISIQTYIASLVKGGVLTETLLKVEQRVQNLFGSHLNLKFYDCQLNEVTEEPSMAYTILIDTQSDFHSKGLQ